MANRKGEIFTKTAGVMLDDNLADWLEADQQLGEPFLQPGTVRDLAHRKQYAKKREACIVGAAAKRGVSLPEIQLTPA